MPDGCHIYKASSVKLKCVGKLQGNADAISRRTYDDKYADKQNIVAPLIRHNPAIEINELKKQAIADPCYTDTIHYVRDNTIGYQKRT